MKKSLSEAAVNSPSFGRLIPRDRSRIAANIRARSGGSVCRRANLATSRCVLSRNKSRGSEIQLPVCLRERFTNETWRMATSAVWKLDDGVGHDLDVTRRVVEHAESRARLQVKASSSSRSSLRGNVRQYAQALHRQADELCQR